jgi:hypothetical protein
VPNAVDEPVMFSIKEHWSENQIVEILGAICFYGFLNCWNDSMTTQLEDAPKKLGNEVLAGGGWDGGKHVK